ncbi:MAG TPA: hypothetical protein VGT02_02535 [Methylomirabilota bacterium]|jgi:hypothetical protein|nr:hypothetical protein [Methylomirabilota bacterium]
MPRSTIAAVVLVVAAALAAGAAAQPPAGGRKDEAADAYGDMLRRIDPAAHARYARLREARDASLEALVRARDRYRSAGPELRALSLPELRAANRKYAADALAFLDFLDERDRQTQQEYRAAIGQIDGVLAERARAREELKELTKE